MKKIIRKLFESKKYIILALGVILSLNLFVHWPEIKNYYYVYPDIKNNYFLNFFKDNSLFRNDIICDYLATKLTRVYTCFLLYTFLVYLKPLTIVSALKLVSIIQGVLTASAVFLLSAKLKGYRFAFFNMIIFSVYGFTTNSFFGGVARGWNFFIVSVFFYLFLLRKYNWMLLAIALAFLMYWVAVPGMLLSVSLLYLVDLRTKSTIKEKNVPAKIIFLTICLIGYGIWMKNLLSNDIPSIMDLLPYKNFKYGHMGYFLMKGVSLRHSVRNCIFNLNDHRTGMYLALTLGFVYLGTLNFIIFKKARKFLAKESWIFIFAHLFLFICVGLTFSFVIASRILVSAVPIFLGYYFSGGVYSLFEQFRIRRCLHLVSLAFVIGLVLFCPHHNTRDYSNDSKMYEYVKTLPKDSMIAGTPNMLAMIPLFSQRSVFYMAEFREIPMGPKMSARIIAREDELLKALYSNSLKDIEDFILVNKITQLIIDPYYFSDNFFQLDRLGTTEQIYFEKIKNIVTKKNSGHDFPLLELVVNNSNFAYNNVYIADTDSILKQIKRVENNKK